MAVFETRRRASTPAKGGAKFWSAHDSHCLLPSAYCLPPTAYHPLPTIPTMCGRYTLTRIENLLNYFPWIREVPSANPRYNIAPTQPVLAVANNRGDRFEFFHWGLIP